jgi:hypothetical protein
MSKPVVVNWSRPMLERFKRAHAAALVPADCRNCGGDGYSMAGGPCPACKGTGKEPEPDPLFLFDGNEYATGFASYLIEYLERTIPK